MFLVSSENILSGSWWTEKWKREPGENVSLAARKAMKTLLKSKKPEKEVGKWVKVGSITPGKTYGSHQVDLWYFYLSCVYIAQSGILPLNLTSSSSLQNPT